MRLKRWESPRREGRNHKGKGGAARARQLKKQQQQLRNKLKEQQSGPDNKSAPIFYDSDRDGISLLKSRRFNA